MARYLLKLDPFGQLSARTLLQVWLSLLAGLNGLWCLGALALGSWAHFAQVAVMFAAVGAAALLSHPGAKLALLTAWIGWWLLDLARSPDPHLGIALVVGMSAWVVVRAGVAWRRKGTTALRVGLRHPLERSEEWPELAGLSKQERRLVLSRARARLPRPKVFSGRVWIALSVLLALQLLEIAFVALPDSDSNPRTVELPRSGLGIFLMLLLLIQVDPETNSEPLRRALQDHVLPEFRRQPWLWDRSRRETARGNAT